MSLVQLPTHQIHLPLLNQERFVYNLKNSGIEEISAATKPLFCGDFLLLLIINRDLIPNYFNYAKVYL